jgi:class 3 adenylate cyclase
MDTSKSEETVAYWCQLSDASEKSGDHLGASDTALLGLEHFPHARELQYRAVLNLSRAGAQARALQIWQKFGLDATLKGSAFSEIFAALGARLSRELALAAGPSCRSGKLREAAAQYETIYRRTQGTFPGINAAVLHELTGNHNRAAEIAGYVIEQSTRASPETDEAAYHVAADKAAASLLLNKLTEAQAALLDAAGLAENASSIASTRKQLLQICKYKGIDESVLSPLKNRSVIHYTGHIISARGKRGRFRADAEAKVAQKIKDALERCNAGYGYGSLACGADILVVEALLERAAVGRPAEINVVLPFEPESFRRESLSQCDPVWLTRFERCLKRVTVSQATDGEYAGDPGAFAYASRLAMGRAVLRAQHLCSDLVQVAVWDGEEVNEVAGTWTDIREWRSHGLETLVIDSEGDLGAAPRERREGQGPELPARKVRAIMFGDFVGFSKLTDRQMLVFFEHVISCVALTLDQFDAHIVTRNTWGDGIYVVFQDLRAAARCALAIQFDLARLDLASLALPSTLGLRLGLDLGAVFEIKDPILKSVAFTGSHICRTARLEPNTPPGEVYVTETFAALLMLDHPTEFTCDYVGLINAAKGYGRLRAYLLKTV